MASHMKRLPVNPFAMCLVGFPKLRVNRLQFLPVYQRRQNEFEPILSQKARCLVFSLAACGKPHQLLGGLVRIGQHHDRGDWRPSWLDQQTMTEQPIQYRPTHLINLVARSFRNQRRMRVIPKPFHPRRQARIHRPDDRLEMRAIGLDRFGISCRGRKIARPQLTSFGHGFLDLAFDESVRAIHQSRGEIGFLPIQWLGLRQGLQPFSRRAWKGGHQPNHGAK